MTFRSASRLRAFLPSTPLAFSQH